MVPYSPDTIQEGSNGETEKDGPGRWLSAKEMSKEKGTESLVKLVNGCWVQIGGVVASYGMYGTLTCVVTKGRCSLHES